MARLCFAAGVNAYEGFEPLLFAERDASEFFEVLTMPGVGDCDPLRSQLLLSPGKRVFEEALERFFLAARTDDQIIFYFAGHGHLSRDMSLNFCLKDTQKTLVASSATAVETIDRVMRWSPCNAAAMILDCCFSGGATKGTQYRGFGAPDGVLERISGRGRIVISASDHFQPSREEKALGHGLFTHYLLEGLRKGDADLDNDGIISSSDIFRYTYQRVAEHSKGHQKPVYTGIDVEGDLFIAFCQNKVLARIISPRDGRRMTHIKPGAFFSGPENKEITLDGFYIDVYPVTNAEYALFVRANNWREPSHWRGETPSAEILNEPVNFVDFHDAAAYAAWVGKRLPTAEQWEKAARSERGYRYPWGNAPTPAKCNVKESGIGALTAVDRFSSGASAYGVYDLIGNVWEWCHTTTTDARRRVLKGGSYNTPFERCEAAINNDAFQTMTDDDTGFRCVMDESAAAEEFAKGST